VERRALPGTSQLRIAEFDAPALGGGESVLRALADPIALLLGHQRQDTDRQLVRVRHVTSDEVHPGVSQVQDKPRVTGKAIQLGNHQPRPRSVGKV
jgi:hypothetical protein